MYFLGVITGILVSIFLLSVLIYFRSQVERKIKTVERWIETSGPRPKGEVFIPEDDAQIVRNQIIQENKRLGKDTYIDELI